MGSLKGSNNVLSNSCPVKAFDKSVDFTDPSELENSDAKDVLNNELSKTEFAEMLSMAPDSLFVEQMFELVDKDQSGSLSFREFLDVIVIFAKGRPTNVSPFDSERCK